MSSYSSRPWARARRRTLDRDGWRCRSCGKAGLLEVDHVQPIARGGAFLELDNLQSLCRPCHFAKTAAEFGYMTKPDRRAWLTFLKTAS